jgi:PAS domain S-box-containing protein
VSFRLKTIIGVALIEALLLLVLVWSAVNFLEESNENELALRAQVSAESLANLTKDAVLATDLARLDSVVERALESPEIVYLRIMDSERVLSQRGDAEALARPFQQDASLEGVVDGVFDVGVDIAEGGYQFGRIELGLSTGRVQSLISDARRHLSGLAVVEMMLVALFSFLLGAYLTRGLNNLTQAARSISEGELGTCVDVKGNDELAETGNAFNTMSLRLERSQREMARASQENLDLATRLAEKEKRLSTILDTAVDAFITIDRNGVIDDINAAGAALFGYRVGELKGRNVSCLMPRPDAARHDSHLQRYLATGEAHVIGSGRRTSGLRKDGSTFPIDLAVSEMSFEGEPMFVGLIRDLTDQLRAEASARKSNAMRAAIVEANLDALVTVDADDRIVEFSPVAEAMFGHTSEAVLGRRMGELIIPPEMRAMHARGMERFLATGEGPVIGRRIEVEAIRADGQRFPVELTVQSVNVDGEHYFTALIRDISDLKAKQAMLKRAREQAESASEAKSRFLAHMSHEIRSPLNAMLGSVGLLLDGHLGGEQRLYAQTAQTAGRTLLGLINDVLDFSKIEAGELVVARVEFDLDAILGEIADLAAFHVGEKDVQTGVGRFPGMRYHLMGDPGRLRQILVNLVDNALKFTDQGAVVLRTERLAETAETMRLRFTVEDTGIGIPPEAQASLFEEFQQVDSSDSTRHGGSGLGLSICDGLVRAMGGVITLDSAPGRGSCFSVEIPFEKGSSTEMRSPIQPSAERRVFEPSVVIVGLHPLVRDVLAMQCVAPERCVTFFGSVADAAPRLGPDTTALFVNGALPADDIEQIVAAAEAVGVPRRVLIAPRINDRITAWIQAGRFEQVFLMPLVIGRIVELLRRGPADNGPAALPGESVAGELQTQNTDGVRSQRRLLLVEDSTANQLVALALLRKRGHVVDVAVNGREAVERIEKGAYDLVLMDLRMPEMNGLEATAAIRAMPGGKDLPIIAMTANAMQQDVERCLAAGMDDYVAKPVDRQQFFAVLDRFLLSGPTADDAPPAVETPQVAHIDEPSLPVIDDDAMRRLAADVTEQSVPGMLQLFVDEIEQRGRLLLDALERGSVGAAEDEAHTLKSGAGTFGAYRLQRLAADIESACREGNPAAAGELGASLREALAETLVAYLDRYGVSPDPTNDAKNREEMT